MNDHNANELCGVLSGAYCFAELDVRITEALELADSCNHIGIDLAQLAAPLDAAARAAEAEEETAQPHLKRQRSASDVADVLPGERRAVLDVSAFDPHTANAVLTCAGRYCALVNQPGLALGHFRAALAASSTGGIARPACPSPRAAARPRRTWGWCSRCCSSGFVSMPPPSRLASGVAAARAVWARARPPTSISPSCSPRSATHCPLRHLTRSRSCAVSHPY